MSFIVQDEEEYEYDPMDPNRQFFPKKNYVFKSSSDEQSLSEANFDQIEHEEMISA